MSTFQQRWLVIGTLLLVPGAGFIGFVCGRNSVASHARNVAPPPETTIVADSKIAAPPTAPAVLAAPAPSNLLAAWETRWRELMSKPCTRARDELSLAAIEELARLDPARAIALALEEPRLRVRQDRLRAALRGWGQVAPAAAADWAVSQQTALDKADAVSAVLAGAAQDPEAAIRLVSHLSQTNPDLSGSLGTYLISTLGARGEFSRAAVFATTAAPNDRLDWITTAYSMWADYQPDSALAAANALTDPALKGQALDAIISAWSSNDPETVAALATKMPAGPQRELAYTDALRNWAANDPAAAAEWINNAAPSHELDAGVSSIATSPQLLRTPAIAISWAESIMDDQLRSRTLAEIVGQWAVTDPAAARQYLETSPDMTADEQTLLRTQLGLP